MTTLLLLLGEMNIYFLTLITVILSLRGNYFLFKAQRAMFIQKRNPLVLFGINLSLMTAMLLGSMLTIATIYNLLFLTLICNVLGVICYYSILFHAITRQWMIFYIGKWTFYTKEAKWKDIITDSKDDNWFVRNKSSWGSLNFIVIVFGSYHLFAVIIGITGAISHALGLLPPLVTTAMTTVPFLLCIALYTATFCATRAVEEEEDIFFIAWESKWISRLLLLMLFFVIVNSVLIEILDPTVAALLFFPIWIINTYLIHHISTYSIYAKNIESSVSSYDLEAHTDMQSGSNADEITLRQVLSTEESLHLFMAHLGNEYSMELLLSFIEIQQYQQDVIHYEEIQMDASQYEETQLPNNVPVSAIIERPEGLQMKAHQIYKKYMESGCDLQINISFKMKQNLVKLFKDVDALESIQISDIFLVFDDVKNEMFTLMRYAFGRFKGSCEFPRIESIFQTTNRTTTCISGD